MKLENKLVGCSFLYLVRVHSSLTSWADHLAKLIKYLLYVCVNRIAYINIIMVIFVGGPSDSIYSGFQQGIHIVNRTK